MEKYRGQHEVWARTCWAAIDVAERNGLEMEGLFDGLPFDAARVRRLRRVDWVDYCTIIERIEERAGGPERCREMTASSYHEVVPELRAMAGSMVSPKTLYRLVWEVVDPIMFPPISFTFEDLGGDRLRLGFKCRPRARPCLSFFEGSMGAIEGMPQHLDLPAAELVLVDITPRGGLCELVLPHSRTLAARVERASRAALDRVAASFVLGYDDDGIELGATVGTSGAGDDIERRIEAATQTWGLTPRQTDVLGLLASGRSNKEIAQLLECAENTVELHVTQLLRKASATSRAQLIARFWSTL